MSTSHDRGLRRLAWRAAVAGVILAGASLAVSLFILRPVADGSSAYGSRGSAASVALILAGLALTAASAVLWGGLALWSLARRWRAGRAGRPARPL